MSSEDRDWQEPPKGYVWRSSVETITEGGTTRTRTVCHLERAGTEDQKALAVIRDREAARFAGGVTRPRR